MPSVPHELLVQMLRDDSGLFTELFRRAGPVALPPHDEVVSEATDLGTALPEELRADCVLRLNRGGEAVLAAVVEVQLAPKPDKTYVWPAYVVSVRKRLRCDVILVVLTVDRATAEWASRPIVFGPGTGYLQAVVFGPDEVPAITAPEEALAAPHLAVLSAVAHGRDADTRRAVAIASAAMVAVRAAMGDEWSLYYDYIWAGLSDAARKEFEMLPRNHEYQHPGLRQAKAEGLAEGEAKGEARGKAKGLLQVLEARDLPITEIQRARILACTDLDRLGRWLSAAVSAASVDDVLAS